MQGEMKTDQLEKVNSEWFGKGGRGERVSEIGGGPNANRRKK